MFCPKCGTENSNDALVCTNCGNQFEQRTVVAPTSNPGKGLGIASMVLGIVSLALFCVIYLSIPCALVGVVLGGVGLKKSKDAGMPAGMAVAGLVCSIICLAIVIIIYAAGATAASSLGF